MMYNNIDAERARKKLSIDDFCTAIGVTRNTYYWWLKKGDIPAGMLAKMARLFGCSCDYLLGLAEERAKTYNEKTNTEN